MDITYGETKNCAGCRFWSEMIAKCDGGGPIEAYCLGNGKNRAKYVTGRMTCDSWKHGELGAVDQPGECDQYAAESRGE